MACDFTPRGSDKSLNENEMKAYLLDGGLRSFIDSGAVNVKEIADYFKAQKAEEIKSARVGGEEKTKGIIGRLLESETLPEPYRQRLQSMKKYQAASQEEADAIAQQVIAIEGEGMALDLARGLTLGGDVSSAIFATVLNTRYNRERAAAESGNAALAMEEADNWAELSIEYDNMAREMGRFTSFIKRFYAQSPMGLAAKMKKNGTEEAQDKVISRQKATFDEMLADIQDMREFEEYMSKAVKDEISKHKPKEKQTKKEQWVKKVDKFFDNLKIDPSQKSIVINGSVINVKQNSILPPMAADVWNGAVDLMKKAVISGKSITDAVKEMSNYIAKKIGTFDSKSFEEEMTTALTDLYSEVTQSEWQKLSKNLMPKQGGSNLKIATDIGKVNGYLARRNDAERGKVLAALVSKMEEMGVLPTEKVGDAISDGDVLSEYIAKLDDQQKAEVIDFLQSRISEQKSESKRAAVLANTIKILEARRASLQQQIDTGERIKKESKVETEDDPVVKQLKESIALLEKELDEKVPDTEGDKKKLEAKKKSVQKSIDNLNEQIKNRKRNLRPAKEGGLSDAELESLKATEAALRETLDQLVPKADKPPKTFEQKVKATTKALEKEINYYQGLIDRREFDKAQAKEKVDTPEITALREKLKALKEQHKKWQDEVISSARPDQAPNWHKENIINKYLKKIKHMTAEQKEQFMRKALISVVANDGLNYDEFKQMLADVMGYGAFTPELQAQVEQWARDINDVEVKRKALLEQRTDEAMADLYLAELKADVANFSLNEKLYKRANAVYTFASLMQLNTLGLVSIVKNLSYNVFERPLRMLSDLYRTFGEYAIDYASQLSNKLFGTPMYDADFNAFLGAKGYVDGMMMGFREGGRTVATGQQKIDYYQSQQFNTRIRPAEAGAKVLRSVKNTLAQIKKMDLDEVFNSDMTFNEIADTALQAFAGWHGEAIARLLTLFDKPFRYASERARADQIAKLRFADEIKTKTDLDIFAKLPLEESRRIYYQRFLAQGMEAEAAMEEANKKAMEVEAEISGYGDRAIFTQNNLLALAIEGMSDGLRKVRDKGEFPNVVTNAGQILLKSQFLFVRIPSNVAWSVINYALPYLAITQGVSFLVAARIQKKKGEPYQASMEAGKKWLSHAAVGMTIAPLAAMLLPALTGGDDDDEMAGEFAAQQDYAPSGHINLSMVRRILAGSSDNRHRKTDTTINLSWLGAFGAYLKMKKIVQEKGMEEFIRGGEKDLSLMQTLSTYGLYTLSSAGLSTTIDGLSSLKGSADGGTDYLVNTMNTLMNVFQPATFAQLNKASMDYNYRIYDEDMLTRVQNSASARSGLLSYAMNHQPPERITVWGEKDNREDTSTLGNLKRYFGFSEGRKTNFAPILFDLATATQDPKFLPTHPTRNITVAKTKIELSRELWDELKTEVGQARFMALNSALGGQEGKFNEKLFTDATYVDSNGRTQKVSIEAKQKFLSKIYEQAGKLGRAVFVQKHEKELTEFLKEKRLTNEQIAEYKEKVLNLLTDETDNNQ